VVPPPGTPCSAVISELIVTPQAAPVEDCRTGKTKSPVGFGGSDNNGRTVVNIPAALMRFETPA
jgi:hypothetical protein